MYRVVAVAFLLLGIGAAQAQVPYGPSPVTTTYQATGATGFRGFGPWAAEIVDVQNPFGNTPGAKGDWITVTNGTTSTSNGTFCTSSYTFTSADIGKHFAGDVMGAAGVSINGSIASVTGGCAVPTPAIGTIINGTAAAKWGTDNKLAIQAAATYAKTQMAAGTSSCLYFPPGVYYTSGASDMSCQIGAGGTISKLAVDQQFDNTANGVITVRGYGFSPVLVVSGLGVSFAQPSDQGSRAAFQTLAAGCTSGLGGTGCKYPPAVYDAATSYRVKFDDIYIERAWDGITFVGNAGSGDLDHLLIGAIDVGFTADGIKDYQYIGHFFSQAFGIDTSSALYTGVYTDGSTLAASVGEIDGWTVDSFTSFYGGLTFTANAQNGWFSFGTLQADLGANVVVSGAQNLQIANYHSTKNASSTSAALYVDGSSSVQISNGWSISQSNQPLIRLPGTSSANLYVTNFEATNNGNGNTFLIQGGAARLVNVRHLSGQVNVAGGFFQQNGGQMNSGSSSAEAAIVTGGTMSLHGVTLRASSGVYTSSHPPIRQGSTGILIANDLPVIANGGSGVLIGIGADVAGTSISGIGFKGTAWTMSGPATTFATGPVGIYGPNVGWSQRSISTGTSDTQLLSDMNGTIVWNSATSGAKAQTIFGCGSNNDGNTIKITDGAGTAATDNITVTPQGGTIGGAASQTISTNGATLKLQCNGAKTNWTIQ